jgi:hypothetical protein
MKKIVSFGDSFIFGSEIPNNHSGQLAWPGLIASELGVEYQTLAEPGVGNEHIARQIYMYFSENSADNCLAVINWTWIMRWDFYLVKNKSWISLGPTCVPKKLCDQVDEPQAQRLIDFYNDYAGNSDLWNLYRSLQAILSAQSYLKSLNIKTIQTYMDHSLINMDRGNNRLEHYNVYKDPTWPTITCEDDLALLPEHIKNEIEQDYACNVHTPPYIKSLQNIIKKPLETFEGRTFLDWCKHRGFEITPTPGDHPLLEAHKSAAELWKSRYQQAL